MSVLLAVLSLGGGSVLGGCTVATPEPARAPAPASALPDAPMRERRLEIVRVSTGGASGDADAAEAIAPPAPPRTKIEAPAIEIPDPEIAARVSELVEEAMRADEAMLPPAAPGTTLRERCEVRAVLPDAVSLLCARDGYAGGAHGISGTYSLAFTWAGGAVRPLRLEELFRAGSDWAPRLERLYTEALRKDGAPWVLDGSFSVKPSRLHTWVITPEALVVIFDPYEAGPHADGPYVETIAWPALGSVLAPDGAMRSRAVERTRFR